MGLETVELIVAWEQAFGISIPDGTAAGLVTPEIAAKEICKILDAEGRSLSMPEIYRIIKETTLGITGLGDADYGVSLRFVEDLGMD